MEPQTIQAKDLLKTEDIYKASLEDTLASALSQVTRTHDAIFVFDEKDKFMGVINPYYTVFQKNHPPETKLKHCLYHPPALTPETYIWDVAKLMNESKIYYLPVFNKNAFVGIVTLNRVLGAISALTGNSLHFTLKKQVKTIDYDATLQEAYTLLRDQRVSRLPVVDEQGRLVGLVTRYDIQKVIAEPKEKSRFLSIVVEKENFLERPMDGHYQKIVVTASLSASPHEIIDKLYSQNVGSVVIVDHNRRPIGIVSTHDILTAVDALRPKAATEFNLQLSPDFIHESHLTGLLNKFVEKIEKVYPIDTIQVVLKTDKNPAGKIKRYEFSVQVEFKNHHPKVIGHAEGYEWKKTVHEVLDKVKTQLFD